MNEFPEDVKERLQDAFRVVLVQPADSRNVGATARAMGNLGFSDLHLVAPVAYSQEKAEIAACGAEHLLNGVVIHPTFEEAVGDCEEVVALSGRQITSRNAITLPEWASLVTARGARKTAIVFGPERDGLAQEHLERCRWIVRIPTNEESWSLNLAQAVLIVLYELTRTTPQIPSPPAPTAEDPATADAHFHLDRLLDAVMTESGFVRPGSPAPVPGTVRSLFRRLDMDKREMGILLALFSRLNRELRHRGSDRAR